MQKNHACLTQHTIYSGYLKKHRLSTLYLCLLSGIHYMYGICSIHQSDRSMVNMSDVNQFLVDIQNHHNLNGRLYVSYGDTLFTILRCVYRAHVGDIINPLTRDEELENIIMNAVRITIEHDFAILRNIWCIMERYKEFELGQENPHVKMLVVAY